MARSLALAYFFLLRDLRHLLIICATLSDVLGEGTLQGALFVQVKRRILTFQAVEQCLTKPNFGAFQRGRRIIEINENPKIRFGKV